MSLGVRKLLPSDCLNINEFQAIHMNTHSDAHEYSLEHIIIWAGTINSLSNLLVYHTFICLKRRLISILIWMG